MATRPAVLSGPIFRGRIFAKGDTPSAIANVPNIITVVRILFVPVFVWVLLADAGELGGLRYVAAIMFVVLIATDSLDGFLARSRNLVTDMGKLLDPIADKALIGAALIGLSILGELWWWVTILILVRELGITVFRFIALKDHVIAAGVAGKAKTIAQAIAVSLLLLPLWPIVGEWYLWLGWGVMGIAFVLTIYSGVEYLVAAARAGRAAPTPLP
jgi:CDP-diacylglycerol---glycerol-3-phosphate 3-phosphatidyltransferase